MQERFDKDSHFSKVHLKDFGETFQNPLLREVQLQWHLHDIYGYFPLAEIHQTISFSMLQTKKIKKSVRDCNLSFMNLEQLILTWKGWHLVLALFASICVMQLSQVKFTRNINHRYFNFLLELPTLKMSLICSYLHCLLPSFNLATLKKMLLLKSV